jgi:hypothetical protein
MAVPHCTTARTRSGCSRYLNGPDMCEARCSASHDWLTNPSSDCPPRSVRRATCLARMPKIPTPTMSHTRFTSRPRLCSCVPPLESSGCAAPRLCETAQPLSAPVLLWRSCQHAMATERDSTRTANANCSIASGFRRWWQGCADAGTRRPLPASDLSAHKTRAARRGSEIDRARRARRHSNPVEQRANRAI